MTGGAKTFSHLSSITDVWEVIRQESGRSLSRPRQQTVCGQGLEVDPAFIFSHPVWSASHKAGVRGKVGLLPVVQVCKSLVHLFFTVHLCATVGHHHLIRSKETDPLIQHFSSWWCSIYWWWKKSQVQWLQSELLYNHLLILLPLQPNILWLIVPWVTYQLEYLWQYVDITDIFYSWFSHWTVSI